MSLQKLNAKLTAVSPLLLHNGQTADPLNTFAKQLKSVSGKRMKTDADFEEMATIEWMASLYFNDAGKLVLPDYVIEATLVNAAKKTKAGKQALAGLFCEGHALLEFDGSELTPQELWERGKNRFTTGVRVGTAKVMRTRCKIDDWAAQIALVFDDELLNLDAVKRTVDSAGKLVGICDWRPKYGRFNVEFFD